MEKHAPAPWTIEPCIGGSMPFVIRDARGWSVAYVTGTADSGWARHTRAPHQGRAGPARGARGPERRRAQGARVRPQGRARVDRAARAGDARPCPGAGARMSAHTPGPWTYSRHYGSEPKGHIFMERAVGACVIELHGAAAMPQDVLDAHGRVMAAAPALLAALEALFEHCAMVHKHWGDGANTAEADAAMRAGRAALALARGEA
jgi:hypothetical protein